MYHHRVIVKKGRRMARRAQRLSTVGGQGCTTPSSLRQTHTYWRENGLASAASLQVLESIQGTTEVFLDRCLVAKHSVEGLAVWDDVLCNGNFLMEARLICAANPELPRPQATASCAWFGSLGSNFQCHGKIGFVIFCYRFLS